MGNQVRGILLDISGNVWAGGHFGLAYYDRGKAKYFTELNTSQAWINCLDERDDQVYLFGNSFHVITLSDRDKNVSENDRGVPVLIDNQTALKIGHIWAAKSLPNHRYLVGNNFGKLLIWNMVDKTFDQVKSCGQMMPFSNYIYRIIFSPSDQHYWAVGGSGCYRISKEFCITDFYGSGVGVDEQHRIPVDELQDLYEDPQGIFWLASNGEGLLRWDRETGLFQSFTVQDGLPSNTLYCILPDDFGNLWISTENGLVRFNTDNHSINVLVPKMALPTMNLIAYPVLKQKMAGCILAASTVSRPSIRVILKRITQQPESPWH